MNTRLPLDVLAIRRHILAQMGVGLWVDRQLCPAPKHPWQCRFGQDWVSNGHFKSQMLDALVFDSNSAKPSSHINPLPQTAAKTDRQNKNRPQQPLSIANVPDLVKPQPEPWQLIPKAKAEHTASDKPTIDSLVVLPKHLQGISVTAERFNLYVARHKQLLLIADRACMSTEDELVWQNLESHLQRLGDTQLLMAAYPLFADSYPEYQSYNQGIYNLLGVLMCLCPADDCCLVLLTPLSAGIDLGALLAYQTPALTHGDVLNNPRSKNTLWQLLQAQ